MADTKCIAMLLAGGQGSRLKKLTKNNAKPGVIFGGKYRIIDFSLSNCFNSDIYTIGVLVQYKPLILGRYIGNGSSWALDKIDQGIYILPPHSDTEGEKWYHGTAHAVFQNIEFIDMYNPEYVLILSGDHIYKMDYSEMLSYSIENDADLTVSVREVEWKDASRFGIMNVDENNKIIEFNEKPDKPKSNMASMGIYIFKWKALKEALLKDEKDENSFHDFGKNIIPRLLNEEKNVLAYHFEGYWRDVGTVESYYEANMDLLKDDESLDLYSKNMRIYSNNTNRLPHYVGTNAKINDSLICDGCIVNGNVKDSILSYNVKVGENAHIKDSIIFSNVEIESGAVIEKAIVGADMKIEKNRKVGNLDSDEITVVT